MSPPHAPRSGHGWTPIPRLPPPSLGFIPGLTATVSLGLLWSWLWVSLAAPRVPAPSTVGSLLPAPFNYPDTSRRLPAKVPDECRGERHFGLRKDTRRLACLPLRLILDSICSLLCGALAGCQPGELKAPAQSSLSPAAGRRRRRRRQPALGGEPGDPRGRLVPSFPAGMFQHRGASRAAACCEVSESQSHWFGLEDHPVPTPCRG